MCLTHNSRLGNMLVACVCSLRAWLVACKESNQALGSQEAVDWIPGPSMRCVPHAAQSISRAGPGETYESSISPEPLSSRAISRTRRMSRCRRRRWRELRLCGKKAAGEFWSPPALPPPYLAQRSPPNPDPPFPPNRARPLRRSEAMAGSCAAAERRSSAAPVMRSSAAAFASVPSPSSPTPVLAVRALKP
jgi:hypothetical protein